MKMEFIYHHHEKYVTMTDASEILHISRQRVNQLIKDKKLNSIMLNMKILVSYESVKQRLQNQTKDDLPAKIKQKKDQLLRHIGSLLNRYPELSIEEVKIELMMMIDLLGEENVKD